MRGGKRISKEEMTFIKRGEKERTRTRKGKGRCIGFNRKIPKGRSCVTLKIKYTYKGKNAMNKTVKGVEGRGLWVNLWLANVARE